MKYEIKFTTQFKKDLKLAKKQRKDLDKLFEVVEVLANGGKKPGWAHAETNEGSRKTATSAGFKPCKVNTVIHKK